VNNGLYHCRPPADPRVLCRTPISMEMGTMLQTVLAMRSATKTSKFIGRHRHGAAMRGDSIATILHARLRLPRRARFRCRWRPCSAPSRSRCRNRDEKARLHMGRSLPGGPPRHVAGRQRVQFKRKGASPADKSLDDIHCEARGSFGRPIRTGLWGTYPRPSPRCARQQRTPPLPRPTSLRKRSKNPVQAD